MNTGDAYLVLSPIFKSEIQVSMFPTQMCEVVSDHPPPGNSNENFFWFLHSFTV
jgi:hypothetical protein